MVILPIRASYTRSVIHAGSGFQFTVPVQRSAFSVHRFCSRFKVQQTRNQTGVR